MGAVRLQKKRACMAQGKKFRTVNPVYRKIYRYRLCPRNEFRRNFEFFGFKIQKFIKNENRIFRPDFVAFRSDFGAFRSENIVLAM